MRTYQAIPMYAHSAISIEADTDDDARLKLLEMSHPSDVVAYALLDTDANLMCEIVEVCDGTRN